MDNWCILPLFNWIRATTSLGRRVFRVPVSNAHTSNRPLYKDSIADSVVDYIIFSPAAELHLITSTFDPSPS
jgi:hypothetical protein